MLNDKIILMSLTHEELRELIRTAVKDEIIAANSKKKERELLNSKELCEYLGIHISTLNNWKRESKIPFKRIGKRIFYERVEVRNALKKSNYKKLEDLS